MDDLKPIDREPPRKDAQQDAQRMYEFWNSAAERQAKDRNYSVSAYARSFKRRSLLSVLLCDPIKRLLHFIRKPPKAFRWLP